MSVVYVQFELSVHGLNIKTQDELNALQAAIKNAVDAIHPGGRTDDRDGSPLRLESDVEIELVESAGNFEN